jgi:hypothetical protein
MAFNTTSFLAGVGSVVVVLSTGFAGGYFFASPDHSDPPNRLQRVATDTVDAKTWDTKTADTKPAPAETPQSKPEVAAVAATPAQAEPLPASTAQSANAPSPTASPASSQQPATSQQAAAEQTAPPAVQQAATNSEPAPAAAQATGNGESSGKPNTAREKTDADRARTAETKAAGKKRAEARKFAEQQRRQRELEIAASAVRHIIHDRDGDEIIVRDAPPQDVVEVGQAEPPGPDLRPFNFFGR